MGIRLDKYLCDAGVGTRSEVKKYIKSGRITINGAVEKDSARKISVDTVCFDGKEIRYEKYRYYMLNKPAGCVSATNDKLSDTVIDLLSGENTKDLFPVGRLDKDTVGLLLITNDGQLAHEMLSPKKHVDKTYIAVCDKKLSEDEIEEFKKGIDIGDETVTLPCKIEEVENENFDNIGYIYRVTVHEGRFHQVKRMFEHFGSKVVYLKRIRMGALSLDDELKEGEFRKLKVDEVEKVTKAYKCSQK